MYRAYGSGSVSRRGKGTSVENGTGESLVATAEPAGFWTYAEFELSIVGREETMLHRGRMVSLFFDIVPYRECRGRRSTSQYGGERFSASSPRALSSIYQWKRGRWESCASAVAGRGCRGALAERVRASRQQRPTMIWVWFLRFFAEWLAGVWSGEGGLVATVPQDRRQSRRKHKTDKTGRRTSGK
ncbi:MAG: hypothetical protein K0Q55_2767 [Verrucomicrobia bacterium]|nr:hypothetical protein [Verrucomicrobiota bacterium]